MNNTHTHTHHEKILIENSSITPWVAHPERVFASARSRQVGKQAFYTGVVFYKDLQEKVRVLVNEDGEEVSSWRFGPVDTKEEPIVERQEVYPDDW